MTKKEIKQALLDIGVKQEFKGYQDPDSELPVIVIKVRKKTANEIALGAGVKGKSDTFCVWTKQSQKARAYSIKHNLIFRNLDGECELYVPANLADEILPEFGARIKAHRKGNPNIGKINENKTSVVTGNTI
jgi:hypothetical protein